MLTSRHPWQGGRARIPARQCEHSNRCEYARRGESLIADLLTLLTAGRFFNPNRGVASTRGRERLRWAACSPFLPLPNADREVDPSAPFGHTTCLRLIPSGTDKTVFCCTVIETRATGLCNRTGLIRPAGPLQLLRASARPPPRQRPGLGRLQPSMWSGTTVESGRLWRPEGDVRPAKVADFGGLALPHGAYEGSSRAHCGI